MRTWHKSLILVLSILTLIGGAWLLAPTAVSAQSETPAEPGGLPAARLANLFQRLQLAHQSLALRLELSDEVVASMEEWIAALQAEGKDTAVLETALAAYETGAANAATHADGARATLDAHAGFDEDGNVTDRAQARATIRAAADDLRLGNRTLTDATRTLRTAIMEYRQANR